ncbi:MAG: hypothetical protein CM1200mP16_16670 [Nitrospina sp.]|nr:MAG: hypothetical protein CM1200mP16_16670 [Nitrospina sp.]
MFGFCKDYYDYMNKIKSICVFCASSESVDNNYKKIAKELGREIGKKGIDLVYGGASIGLMGCIARGGMKRKEMYRCSPQFFRSKTLNTLMQMS